MSLHDGPDAGPRWTFLERGSFLIGSCDACGYTTAARRARYSAESDLAAHDLTCAASGEASGDVVDVRVAASEVVLGDGAGSLPAASPREV